MQTLIVPESRMQSLHQEIQTYAAEHRQSYGVDFDDPDYGLAFANYVFFSHHPSVSKIVGIDLDHRARFYNAYFWFQRFVKIRGEKHGRDVGLEQEAFKMLESAEFDLDFEVIDLIDKRAKAL